MWQSQSRWRKNLRRLFTSGLVGCLSLAAAGCQSRQEPASAEASAQLRAKLQTGNFTKVSGTNYLMASAYIATESGLLKQIGSYGSYENRIAPRNFIFVNAEDSVGKWLLPHNNFLFSGFDELPPAPDNRASGNQPRPTPEQRTAKWLYYEIIKADTNKNNRLDHEDRKTAAVSDPSGAGYAELVNDADAILSRTMRGEDGLLLIFKTDEKLAAAEIHLPQRQVTLKDLPAIP